MIRNYELTFVVHPDLSDEEFSSLLEQVKGWVQGQGGDVLKIDDWGRRQLAYPIRNQHEGRYVFFGLQLDATTIPDLERNLKLSEPILRHLLVRADEE